MSLSKKCTVYGNDFMAKNNKAEYCSNACRVKAFRERGKSEKINKMDCNKSEFKENDSTLIKLSNDFKILQDNMKSFIPRLLEIVEIKAQIPFLEKQCNQNSKSILDLQFEMEKKDDKIEKLQDKIRDLEMELKFLQKFGSENDTSKNKQSGFGEILNNENFIDGITKISSNIFNKNKNEAKLD